MDYSSDEEVVSTFVKIAKEVGFNSKKVDLAYLEANAKKLPISKHKNFNEKLNKLKEIADSQILFRNDVVEGFGKFLRSELGERITEEFIEKNKDIYLSDIRDNYRSQLENEFREKNEELAELLVKIEINKQQLINLGQKIEERNQIKECKK